jgi:hypothetical protein
MSLITRTGVFWRAIALVFAFAVTLTLGVVSSGALATGSRGATNSIAYGSRKTESPAVRALLKRVVANSAAYVSPRASRLSSGRTLKRSATNSVTYADSTGEDAAGPDITTVTVSSDDAGLITFQIAVPNRPSYTSDMVYLVLIDSDNNAATGDEDGIDYEIMTIWLPGEAGPSIFLERNSGPNVDVISAPTLGGGYVGGVSTMYINAAELGGTTAFSFWVGAMSGVLISSSGTIDFTNAHADAAPDSGSYPYQVVIGTTSTTTSTTTITDTTTAEEEPPPTLANARLAGKFRVTMRTISVSRHSESQVGSWGTETQRFVPQCSSGACWAKATIPGMKTIRLARSGATYYGSFRWTPRCSGLPYPSLAKVRLHVTKAATINGEWRVTKWQGTTVYTHRGTKTCWGTTQVVSDVGVLKGG